MLDGKGNGVRAFQAYATAVHLFSLISLISLILLIYAGLNLTDGRLVYSLDDPYIHLAVAESIRDGGYGIYAGEFASPASSILFPLLLALGLRMGVGGGKFLPLILSVPFSLAATFVMSGFVWRRVGEGSSLATILTAIVLGLALVLATNAIALPMTGMEHSIHVFATVLALTGFYSLCLDPSNWTSLISVIVGTLLCATIRFEGLALVVAVVAALYALGLRWQAILTGSIVLLILGAYAIVMTSLGLPILPSSVMTKSSIAAQAGDGNAFGIVSGLMSNVWNALNSRWGLLLAILSVILLAAPWAGAQKSQLRIFIYAVVFILFAHIVAGQYDWFGRYEVYVIAAMLLGLFSLVPLFPKTAKTRLTATSLLVIVAAPYAWTTLKNPAASANIYKQKYQMHRFVKEFFPERVAVIDLGYVAFQNDRYVLDLWGLGSEETRRLSSNNRWTPALLDQITERHDIAYAMIYTDWFWKVPSNWCHVADLVTSQVTSARDTVSFYLIKRDQEEKMRAALLAFSSDIPAGAKLQILECGPNP